MILFNILKRERERERENSEEEPTKEIPVDAVAFEKFNL